MTKVCGNPQGLFDDLLRSVNNFGGLLHDTSGHKTESIFSITRAQFL